MSFMQFLKTGELVEIPYFCFLGNISLSVSQSTHNDIELYPLYRILVGLRMYLSTQKAISMIYLSNT